MTFNVFFYNEASAQLPNSFPRQEITVGIRDGFQVSTNTQTKADYKDKLDNSSDIQKVTYFSATFHQFKVAAGQELQKQVPYSGPIIKKPLPSLIPESEKSIAETLMEYQRLLNKERQEDLKEARTVLASTPLTGQWQSSDGGTYYLRQIGNTLWWNGMSGGNDGRTYDNVFRGTITSTTGTIIGEWVDVPRGTIMGSGTLGLKIINPTTLQKVTQTGGFGATTWQKVR